MVAVAMVAEVGVVSTMVAVATGTSSSFFLHDVDKTASMTVRAIRIEKSLRTFIISPRRIAAYCTNLDPAECGRIREIAYAILFFRIHCATIGEMRLETDEVKNA
jgi:hypothetical protein